MNACMKNQRLRNEASSKGAAHVSLAKSLLAGLVLLLGAPLGCQAGDPGEPLEVRASKCDEGGELDQESQASVVSEGAAHKLEVSLRFNCVVSKLCAYELPPEKAEAMDVLLAPCDPKRRDVAKCMCVMSGEIDLPESGAKKVRVFSHGVYRPGESPDRRLLAEIEF